MIRTFFVKPRHVEKSANAILLESRIGEEFDAIVSGASPKGTGYVFSIRMLKGNW